MTATPEIKQFGGKRKPVKFRVDDDEFTAAAKIPAEVMLDLVRQYEKIQDGTASEKVEIMMSMFDTVLFPDSMDLFRRRMKDPENPIDINDFIEIMQWLLGEAYGMRPTVPPSSSPDGLLEDGTSLMAGVSAEASTPSSSPGTGSST